MIQFNSTTLHQALTVLGDTLSDRHLHFEAVAIGGGGLLLLGLITRPTKDVDLVALVDAGKLISAHRLPAPLLQAIDEVGNALDLGENWINTGPSDLFSAGLPEGFSGRLETYDYGLIFTHKS